MSTATGTPLGAEEVSWFQNVDGTEVDEVISNIRDGKAVIDRVVLYHPDRDNPMSVYIVPVNAAERRQALLNLLSKTKMVNGKRVKWNYPNPQVEPRVLPMRCFVSGCARAGGFATRADLIAHVNGKHSQEAPLYQTLIDQLMKLVHLDIPKEQYEALGLEHPEEKPAGKRAS